MGHRDDWAKEHLESLNLERSRMTNTHYAVIVFGGDPGSEHPDEDLRGSAPSIFLLGCGPEDFCWGSAARWTAKHPLRMWEEVEIVRRHPSVVRTILDRPDDAVGETH